MGLTELVELVHTPGAAAWFAAWIHPSNPDSGPYSGLSLVVFPIAAGRCLLGIVVETQGLAPDLSAFCCRTCGWSGSRAP